MAKDAANIVDIKNNSEYTEWISSICKRFKKSQIKASVRVNIEMLHFYWAVGRDIAEKSDQFGYGSAFYKTVSEDLQKVFPAVHSFSVTNLKYMRYFFELYSDAENRQQFVDELSVIFNIPWGHHVAIINACRNDQQKALFYVKKTIENNWSRAVLLNFLDTNLYDRQGKAITNFKSTLPALQGDLAQAVTRDPYNFDFLSVRESYDEKELKDALMNNITRFLLELGSGFAFVGREYRIEVGETEKFIDMLFYNISMKCYVVLEVKVTDFDSSYAGQLGTYIVAVNHQIKTADMNPTVGLLVCRNMDRVEAQYALESSSQPIGVSGYQLSKLIPDEFKGSLPTIEEIESELNDVGK
ncbi:MAG: DUF1016 family protein [Butyrivibrio sp.]|nr:DUF1016 family protein [Butyrivibrio sp.]